MRAKVALLGYGRFGRALADLALAAGDAVAAFDPIATPPPEVAAVDAEHAISGANIVILAMPIAQLEASLALHARSFAPSQLVIDVGSVKIAPSALLEKYVGARVPWAATHPLFGPTSLALGERPLRVIVCSNAQHPAAAKRALDFYESLGCEVLVESADVHDRAMARTHALTFFLAKGVLDAFGDVPPPVFAPASFQGIARAIESVRADAGHLFRTLQIDNPFSADARRAILDALVRLDNDIATDAATPAANEPTPRMSIPDLGAKSPELRETRALIDEVDRELVSLLERRAGLSKRAAAAKSAIGGTTFDPSREASLLEARRAWAREAGLDEAAVTDVFDAILRLSRALQRKD
ncbi:MAG: prephenate dehydrogenase/arogenate dehydrogenase family protein [Polyangiaceae bacterium]